MGNIDALSARSATSASKMFYFCNFLINLITERGGWSDSDIKSSLSIIKLI